MARITLNVTLYQSYILSHYSRHSISLSSSFRGLGRFPSTHRACTSFWNVFSSSSSKTIGTSVGRESRRFNTSLLGQRTSRGSIAVNAFRVSFSRDNLDWMYFLLAFNPINIKSTGNKFRIYEV